MYLDTALGRFLLKRALLNKRIGHTLFWHLRYVYESSARTLVWQLYSSRALLYMGSWSACFALWLCTYVCMYVCMHAYIHTCVHVTCTVPWVMECLYWTGFVMRSQIVCLGLHGLLYVYTLMALCNAQLVGLVCVIGLLLHAELITDNFTRGRRSLVPSQFMIRLPVISSASITSLCDTVQPPFQAYFLVTVI